MGVVGKRRAEFSYFTENFSISVMRKPLMLDDFQAPTLRDQGVVVNCEYCSRREGKNHPLFL